MKVLKYFFGFLFLINFGCASKNKDLKSADFFSLQETRQLTFSGQNQRPRFNDIGDRIVFYSSDRSEHKGSQIYEYDLRNNTVRRITFSDGDAFDPDFISSREILYSSTTDEIKERLFEPKLSDKKSSELYISDLYGKNIVRSTYRPGYDAEGIFYQNLGSNSIIYTSYFDGRSGIFALEIPKMSVKLIAARANMSYESPTLSPDRESLAWIQTDLKTQEKFIVLYDLKGKTTQVIRKNEGDYADLFFAPSSPVRLFYSLTRDSTKPRHIETLNLETNCVQAVFKGVDSLSEPAVSSIAPEKIAFTREFQGNKHIYITRLPSDLGPCIPEPPADTIKE